MKKTGSLVFMGLLIVADWDAAAGTPRKENATNTPAAVIQELRSRGCREVTKESKSFIHGEFIKPGQTDWVALCSTNNSTNLLVFPQGTTEHIAVLETHPRGFSKWTISTIDRETLTRMNSAWAGRGPELGKVDHDGISSVVAVGERGGCLYCYSEEQSIHYWQHDRWLTPETVDVN